MLEGWIRGFKLVWQASTPPQELEFTFLGCNNYWLCSLELGTHPLWATVPSASKRLIRCPCCHQDFTESAWERACSMVSSSPSLQNSRGRASSLGWNSVRNQPPPPPPQHPIDEKNTTRSHKNKTVFSPEDRRGGRQFRWPWTFTKFRFRAKSTQILTICSHDSFSNDYLRAEVISSRHYQGSRWLSSAFFWLSFPLQPSSR